MSDNDCASTMAGWAAATVRISHGDRSRPPTPTAGVAATSIILLRFEVLSK